jgi:hypothetical protein
VFCAIVFSLKRFLCYTLQPTQGWIKRLICQDAREAEAEERLDDDIRRAIFYLSPP